MLDKFQLESDLWIRFYSCTIMNKLNVVLDKYHVLLYSSQTAYIYKFVHAGNTQGPIGCACTILALAELWFSNPFHPMVCQLQSKPVKVHNFFDELLFGYVGLTVCKHILYFHLTIIKWKYDMCLQSVNRYKWRMKGKDFFLLSGSHQLRKVIKLWTFALREGAAQPPSTDLRVCSPIIMVF